MLPHEDDTKDANGLFIDRPGAITTATGGRIDPLAPNPAEISPTDIAHALSRLCRYNGHVGHFLSVARHSLWVSYRLEELGYDAEMQLIGLLHDAAEAYLGDFVRPVKQTKTLGAAYRAFEENLEAAIAERFSFAYPHPEAVKDADNFVLMEMELGGQEYRWNWVGHYLDDQRDFLRRYRRLIFEIGRSGA